MIRLGLRLYYTAGSPLSESARQELKTLRAQFSNVQFEIEEIDVVLNSTMATEDDIYATPTVVKLSPFPVTRVVGDFVNLVQALGLKN